MRITLRGWVSVQLTFLLSLSSPLSIQHHHPLSASFLSSELCAFSSACNLEPCAVRDVEVNPFHPLRYYVAEARDHIGSQLPLGLESDEGFKRYCDVLQLADRRSGRYASGRKPLSFDPPGFLHLSFSLQALSQSAMCHILILILFLAYQGPSECLSVTEIPVKYYGAWRKLRLTPRRQSAQKS